MDKKTARLLHMVSFTLVVAGALNWGLVGLLNLNLVTMLLGKGMLEQVVYVLVGLSAVHVGLAHKNGCRTCGGK